MVGSLNGSRFDFTILTENVPYLTIFRKIKAAVEDSISEFPLPPKPARLGMLGLPAPQKTPAETDNGTFKEDTTARRKAKRKAKGNEKRKAEEAAATAKANLSCISAVAKSLRKTTPGQSLPKEHTIPIKTAEKSSAAVKMLPFPEEDEKVVDILPQGQDALIGIRNQESDRI